MDKSLEMIMELRDQDIAEAAELFKTVADRAVKDSQVVPNPEAETILLWAKKGAIVRFTQDDAGYASIAVESEQHNVYAYWAPDFLPVFLDCEQEDFEKFVSGLTA